jgi:hypothetical protein
LKYEGADLAAMCSASTGQTDTHFPQKVHSPGE